ncbi:MAG: proline--tRNA ligase [Candidatus Omnitrophota bacterium]
MMRFSNAFIPTLKESSQETDSISHALMLRAGLIRMLTSGVYIYLPLGWRVLKKIQDVIRSELDKVGAQELLLPALQPLELWKLTGRDKDLGQTLICFTDRKNRKLCLGPTHEEVITDLVKNNISSYRQMPLILYQIQTKFRDELRPRGGLMRSCEFIMKDAYSFDIDEASLDKNYQLMCDCYNKIFSLLGLNSVRLEADPGVIGGSESHEFMVFSENGEDKLHYCPSCKKTFSFKEGQSSCLKCKKDLILKNAIELAHTFKLGMKYSKVQSATFLNEKGKRQPVIMGCYGIGVSRLLPAIIDQHHDEKGIIWPKEVSPFDVGIAVVEFSKPKALELADKLSSRIESLGKSVLLDDRDIRAGVKFNDLDLIGIPLRIIIGKHWLENGDLEIIFRKDKSKTIKIKEQEVEEKIKTLLS